MSSIGWVLAALAIFGLVGGWLGVRQAASSSEAIQAPDRQADDAAGRIQVFVGSEDYQQAIKRTSR